MSLTEPRIVVVGAGQAGAALVAKLRALGHAGPLTLVGAEPVAPYQRPPLSKAYLKGEMSRERLHLRPDSFYAAEGIDLVTGVRATRDRPGGAGRGARRTAARCPYDLLALTTGRGPAPAAGGAGRRPRRRAGDAQPRRRRRARGAAGARRPGAGRRRRLHRARGRGGAASGRARGDAGRGRRAHPRAGRGPGDRRTISAPCTEATASSSARTTGVARLLGADGRLVGAELADGSRIAADLVLVGIGIAPETALAEAAGLAVENGVRVDAAGRTSDPDDLRRRRLRELSARRPADPARKRAARHRPRRGGRGDHARRCRSPTRRVPGSGRTSTTSSCRSPGSTPAGSAP